MTPDDLEETLKPLIRADPRYPIAAYLFLHEALDYTLGRMGRRGHVTGQELCDGIRRLALEQFGMMAGTVFSSWGIRKTEDFGEIVYNLVNSRLWRKREEDSKEDFAGVYDFHEAFEKDFDLSLGEWAL